MRVVRFRGGEFILREGAAGREMMVVVAGEVEAIVPVSRQASERKAAKLHGGGGGGGGGGAGHHFGCILSEGSIFGEMALLSANLRRAASVVALGDCECGVVSLAHFAVICERFPAFRKVCASRPFGARVECGGSCCVPRRSS